MTILGDWFAELMRRNPDDVRLFGPDEVLSNRLGAVFDVTDRAWAEALHPLDEHLARSGRVIEALSEHLMQGMLEGYLLTGRHGLITSYEAFIHIVDSMFNQHAKWLEAASGVPWRGDVASLNYLLSSHVWRQDHNGFSHQDPGFLNVVVNKQADVVRVYLPPDANTLLEVMRHVFDTQNRVNVIVAGKQPQPQWLTPMEAAAHVEAGIGVWASAGNEPGYDAADPAASVPDVVMACAGDVPTMETVAAAQLLRERLPDLRVRVVNVVDLMRLQDPSHHPHGLNDLAFDAIFTTDAPVIFAFHGYPSLIHQLAYRRTQPREPARARASSSRAPRPRRSTCCTSTTSTATGSRSTCSTACRASPAGPASPRSPTSGTRRGQRRASTRTSTAPIPTGSRDGSTGATDSARPDRRSAAPDG